MNLHKTLTALRAKFNRLPESFHRQVGLRYVREAILLVDRNAVEADRLYQQARFHLPYAEAVS